MFGNGYLCPLTCSLTYLAPVVLAGIVGGYSLIFGMLLVGGVAGMVVSRVVHRLRVLFPPEVTGLMVAMSGLQLVALGCPRFLLDPQQAAPFFHADRPGGRLCHGDCSGRIALLAVGVANARRILEYPNPRRGGPFIQMGAAPAVSDCRAHRQPENRWRYNALSKG
jgi:hypothetical protein